MAEICYIAIYPKTNKDKGARLYQYLDSLGNHVDELKKVIICSLEDYSIVLMCFHFDWVVIHLISWPPLPVEEDRYN